MAAPAIATSTIVSEGCLPMTLLQLLKPVISQLELQGIDTGIRRTQSGVGDMFILGGECERALFLGEQMHSERSMRQKIRCGVSDLRHTVVGRSEERRVGKECRSR